jgi:hypothetical protein
VVLGLAVEVVMEAADVISRILESTGGEGLCDACLAFAVELPLLTVQRMTGDLLIPPTHYDRDVAPCGSCGRVTTTTAFVAAAIRKTRS